MPQERRRHHRMKVVLLGRYMLPNRMEYPCQSIDISPGGLHLAAPAKAAPGERVIVYLEHLGRIEGTCVRTTMEGFAMTITATSRKREKFTAQLTWLANREELGLPEDRRHERIVPRNPRSLLLLDDGTDHPVRIIDISLSGTAISTDLDLPVGTAVRIGSTPARIVRRFDGGLGLEFRFPLSADLLDENLEL
ncbi:MULTISPECIES: PilZ domain-containing protein [unclassified Bosea (in: a-proteobacteria)]|uniref:PilZ domain-containing protein n=1 Tax=unclassified Bosea (in: a-proteobacteria) TaxID=2653178 RepID=UPI001FCDFF45|nr:MULTISPECIES: PilZ domain-containing protein [unclassified Bosea (in: a-proteobacteria)]